MTVSRRIRPASSSDSTKILGTSFARAGQITHSGARREKTYPDHLTGTESSSAIKPVIVAELVDLDTFALLRRADRQSHVDRWGE